MKWKEQKHTNQHRSENGLYIIEEYTDFYSLYRNIFFVKQQIGANVTTLRAAKDRAAADFKIIQQQAHALLEEL